MTLALEPECAAIYVLTGANLVASSKQSDNTMCDPGEKFLVADLGGIRILCFVAWNLRKKCRDLKHDV